MFTRRRAIWPGHATVQEAVRYLASACDGAVRRDGHGFGTDHVALGHWLASLRDDSWGLVEQRAGLDLVRIYRQQLERAGFDPAGILAGRRPRRVPQKRFRGLTPGWFADPAGLHRWRLWNGVRWTGHVSQRA
jgi:hypothetical protein